MPWVGAIGFVHNALILRSRLALYQETQPESKALLPLASFTLYVYHL